MHLLPLSPIPSPEPPLPVRKLKEVLWNWREGPGSILGRSGEKGNVSVPDPPALCTNYTFLSPVQQGEPGGHWGITWHKSPPCAVQCEHKENNSRGRETFFSLRDTAVTKGSLWVSAISEPGAMESGCNSVTSANSSAQSSWSWHNSFQFQSPSLS